MVNAINAKDELETMLAAQMAVVHLATMRMANRLEHASSIPVLDSSERGLNRLARTFASQLEALKRYRTGGEQKVTVEHVHVHEGGQAIVGHVEHRGRGELKATGQAHAKQIAHAPEPSMWGQDQERQPVSLTSNAGRCRMHGGKSPGAPKGNRNAWKHGRYSTDTIQSRRFVQAMARLALKTINDCA